MVEERTDVLQGLQRVIEGVNRKKNPFTAEQLHRFARYPNGPVVPETCVGLQRVSAPVLGLFHDEVGLAYTALEQDGIIYVCLENSTVRMKVGIFRNSNLIEAEILGKGWMTLVREEHGGKIFKHVFVGDKKVGVIKDAEVQSASLLPDGRLMLVISSYNERPISERWYSVRQVGVEDFNLGSRLDNEIGPVKNYPWGRDTQPLPPKRLIRKFVQAADGTIIAWSSYFLRESPNGKAIMEPCTLCGPVVYDVNYNADAVQSRYCTCHGDDIVRCGDDLLFIASEHKKMHTDEVMVWRLLNGKKEVENGKEFMLSNRYQSSGQILPNGRFACIADAHNKLVCWAVNDLRSQPAFEHVSQLFKKDDQWLYYGSIGRHIFTMELPINSM